MELYMIIHEFFKENRKKLLLNMFYRTFCYTLVWKDVIGFDIKLCFKYSFE